MGRLGVYNIILKTGKIIRDAIRIEERKEIGGGIGCV